MQSRRFADATHPTLSFYKKGYKVAYQPVAGGGGTGVNVVLDKE